MTEIDLAIAALVATRPRKAWSLGELMAEASPRWDAARRSWGPHPLLGRLDTATFARALGHAALVGAIMRVDTPEGVRYLDPHATAPIGSDLDEEVEGWIETRKQLRPGGDLPGQMGLFDGDSGDIHGGQAS